MTSETKAATTRSAAESVVRWINLGWVGLAFVYFVRVDQMDSALIQMWIIVEAVLAVAQIALSVRGPR